MKRSRTIWLSRKMAYCPRCGELSRRHSTGRRLLREVGISAVTVLEVIYSKHYCARCRKHFSINMDHLAPAYGRFTHRVRRMAVDLVARQGMTLDGATRSMRQKYFVHIPTTTLNEWLVRASIAQENNHEEFCEGVGIKVDHS